jgi:phosphate transport system substrate-binding protein
MQTIFLADKAAKKWSDVDPSWPNEDITLYAPASCSETFDYFKAVVGGKRNIRGDMWLGEDASVLVTGVAGDKHAIGFFRCRHYFANQDRLRVVPIVNPALNKGVEPRVTTIHGGEYRPFSRPLFLYVRRDSLKLSHVRAFVQFYLDNAAAAAADCDFVPLQESLYSVAKEHYRQRLTGTCLVTEDGSERAGGLVEVFKTENLVR